MLQNTEIVGNLDVCGQTVLQTLTSENIQVNNLVNQDGKSIINSGEITVETAEFGSLDIINLTIQNNLISKGFTDCSNGTLLIPSKNSNNIDKKNSLILDDTNNYLTIYNK